MDAFYASVEQRDDPALRGKPVAVGGGSMRGVVAAASYEARVFGVRSAMASVTARRRCPDLLFVKPRFEVYKAVSNQIRAIFAEYTDLIEPLSLDEAYLDVTDTVARPRIGDRDRAGDPGGDPRANRADRLGGGLVQQVHRQDRVGPEQARWPLRDHAASAGRTFVAALPVKRFHGIGPVTAAKMARLGIETGADLRARPLAWLQAEFGKAADYYYRAARGHDDRPVRPNRAHKSVGAERTFDTDLIALPDLLAKLDIAVEAAWTRVERAGLHGRTVTLKVKFADFRQITRARASPRRSPAATAFAEAGAALLAALMPLPLGVRLIGLTLSGFEDGDVAAERQFGLAL